MLLQARRVVAAAQLCIPTSCTHSAEQREVPSSLDPWAQTLRYLKGAQVCKPMRLLLSPAIPRARVMMALDLVSHSLVHLLKLLPISVHQVRLPRLRLRLRLVRRKDQPPQKRGR